jgi:acyl-CoA thioesterase I
MRNLGRCALAAALVLGACDEGSEPGSGSGGSGGSAGSAAQAGNGGSGGAVASGPRIVRPNPIVSRNRPAFAQPASNAALVVDGNYHSGGWAAGVPTAAAPAWVAIELEPGPSRLLLVWDDGGTYNYEDPAGTNVYGLPAAYRIEVSSDSTNGQDGTWANVVTVPANVVRTRGHAIDFTGQSWVRLLVTGTPAAAPNGVTIGEIDVHDISAGGSTSGAGGGAAATSGLPDDTWLFMGDSITAFAYDRAQAHQPSFAAGINSLLPSHFPAMINAGIGGELTAGALARLDAVLELNPDFRFVILGYGTNDSAGGQVPVAMFKANLQAMVDRIEQQGRVALIPSIPLSTDGNHDTIPDYNEAIDELVAENQLVPGADLYGYFSGTSGLFECPPCGAGRTTDNLHPNDDGLEGMNREWSEAMRGLYPAR